jgi:hypothetical protein
MGTGSTHICNMEIASMKRILIWPARRYCRPTTNLNIEFKTGLKCTTGPGYRQDD